MGLLEEEDKDRASRGAWGATVYPGSDAVRKRLQSCGLSVSKVEMYRGNRGNVWEATTNDGKRWVTYEEGAGWKVSKDPPGRRRK